MNSPEKIRFRCPGCDQPVAAPAIRAGVRMRCPKCKATVTVPVPDAPVAPADPDVPEPEMISRPGPGMLLRGDWLLLRCPACEAWCKVRRANFNRDVACGACQSAFFLELET